MINEHWIGVIWKMGLVVLNDNRS